MKAPRVVIQEILRCQCIHSVSRVTAHELYNHQPEQKLGPQITKQTSTVTTVTTACSMHWWLHDAGLVSKSEHCPSLHFTSLKSSPLRQVTTSCDTRPTLDVKPCQLQPNLPMKTMQYCTALTISPHSPLQLFALSCDPLTAKRRLPLTSREKLQCPKLNLIEVPEMYAKIIRSVYSFFFWFCILAFFDPITFKGTFFSTAFSAFFHGGSSVRQRRPQLGHCTAKRALDLKCGKSCKSRCKHYTHTGLTYNISIIIEYLSDISYVHIYYMFI